MSKYKQAIVRVKFHRDPGINKTGKKKTRKIENAVRYIAFRSRELDQNKEVGIFSRDSDHAPIKDFLEKIKEDKALKHPNTIKSHELVISFRQEDYDHYGVNYKELTRQVMSELEEKKGLKLEWVAAEHLKLGHPHVHVLIKSTGIDREGKTRRLHLDIPKRGKDGKVDPSRSNDMKFIKEKIDDITGRKHIEKRDKALENVTSTMKGFLNDLSKEIGRGMHRAEIEQERARRQLHRSMQREARRNQQRRKDIERGDIDR